MTDWWIYDEVPKDPPEGPGMTFVSTFRHLGRQFGKSLDIYREYYTSSLQPLFSLQPLVKKPQITVQTTDPLEIKKHNYFPTSNPPWADKKKLYRR